MEKKVIIENQDGLVEEVSLVTYLISDDNNRMYLVYSKDEVQNTDDRVIYISKIISKDSNLVLDEIIDDTEWVDVQHLLKRIANAV